MISSFSQAQNYADKNYYLIDSLEYNILIQSEKKILDSSLIIYHKATSDIQKLDAINIIVENSWDDDLWPKYNQWIYDSTKKKLNKILLKGSFKNLNKKEKELLKYYSNAINNFGVVHASKGNLALSLDFFYQSLTVREKIQDTIGISESYINIGSIYHTQGNMIKDVEFNNKALIIAEKLNLKKSLVTIYNNLGVSYSKQLNNVKALEFHKKSLAINKELKSAIGIASSLSQIGRVYKNNGDLEEGLSYLQESLKVIEEYGYQAGVISVLTDIASVYLEQDNTHLAKITAAKAMKVALKYGDPERIMETSYVLSSIYKKNANWKNAFEMQEMYFKMRDSIQNNEIEKNLIQQQSKYDLEKKEQEIRIMSVQSEMQELKLNKNRALVVFFSIALGLALILIFLAYKAYKNKQRLNALLYEQNEEKKVMLQEIHHRVKNNLQVVNSLLRYQSRDIVDKKVLGMFEKAQKRVLSMAMLHEKMYSSENLKHIDVKEHFTLLIEDLVKNYAIEKKISLDIEIDEVDMGIETLTPLGLIINELISNSLKYAFDDSDKGIIMVHLKRLNAKYELIIGDNGVGFTPNNESVGLGTKLIQIFTKQLNGTIEKLEQPGTVYKLVFENKNT